MNAEANTDHVASLIARHVRTYEEGIQMCNYHQAAAEINEYYGRFTNTNQAIPDNGIATDPIYSGNYNHLPDVLGKELCTYLGELYYKAENEFDWIMKDIIINRINAVHCLLGIPERFKTWYEKVAAELKKIRA